DRLLADIGDAHAGDNRQSQAAVDDRPAEFRFRRVGGIEVQRVLVHRQEREPGVVGLADRAPGAMLINIADRELLETAAGTGAKAPRPDFFRDGDHTVLPVWRSDLVSPRQDEGHGEQSAFAGWRYLSGPKPRPGESRDPLVRDTSGLKSGSRLTQGRRLGGRRTLGAHSHAPAGKCYASSHPSYLYDVTSMTNPDTEQEQ